MEEIGKVRYALEDEQLAALWGFPNYVTPSHFKLKPTKLETLNSKRDVIGGPTRDFRELPQRFRGPTQEEREDERLRVEELTQKLSTLTTKLPYEFIKRLPVDALHFQLHGIITLANPVSATPIAEILREDYEHEEIQTWVDEYRKMPYPRTIGRPTKSQPKGRVMIDSPEIAAEKNAARARKCKLIGEKMIEGKAKHAIHLRDMAYRDLDILYKSERKEVQRLKEDENKLVALVRYFFRWIECSSSTDTLRLQGAKPYHKISWDPKTKVAVLSVIVPRDVVHVVFPFETREERGITITANTKAAPYPPKKFPPTDGIPEIIFPYGPFWDRGSGKEKMNDAINEGVDKALDAKDKTLWDILGQPVLNEYGSVAAINKRQCLAAQKFETQRRAERDERLFAQKQPEYGQQQGQAPRLQSPCALQQRTHAVSSHQSVAPPSPSSSTSSDSNPSTPSARDDAWWIDAFKKRQADINLARSQQLENNGDLVPFARSLQVFHTPHPHYLPQPKPVAANQPQQPIDIPKRPGQQRPQLSKDFLEADRNYKGALDRVHGFESRFLKAQIRAAEDELNEHNQEILARAQALDQELSDEIRKAEALLLKVANK